MKYRSKKPVKKTLHRTGQEHPHVKLTEDQVRAIKTELRDETASVRWLANEYGVSHGCIQQIKKGTTWREVTID